MIFGLLNTKEKELIIPRPDYEQSGYAGDLTPSTPLLKWANGEAVLGNGNKDYGVKLTTPDTIFATKLTALGIAHRYDVIYSIPDTNLSDELDLTPFIFLNEINLRSPFLSASNIKLPEIVTPLVSMNSGDGVGGYAGQNALIGVLDLRPLNVNDMFGGSITLTIDQPDLDDIILPTSCHRPITDLQVISRSNSHTDTWGLSGYSRLGGIVNLAGSVKHDIVFPTFVELDAPIITSLTTYNKLSNSNPSLRNWDLSAMHNLGGSLIFRNSRIDSIIFPSDVQNTITSFRADNNNITSLDTSGFKDFNSIFYAGNNDLTSLILPPSATTTFKDLNISNNPALNLGVFGLSGYSFESDAVMQVNNVGLTDLIVDSLQKPKISNLDVGNNSWASNSIDVSEYTRANLVFKCQLNSNIQTIITSANNNFTDFTANECDLTGHLDLSNTTKGAVSGDLILNDNINLTQLTWFGTQLGAIDILRLQYTSINHQLDLTNTLRIPTFDFQVHYNSSTTFDLLFPADGTDFQISVSTGVDWNFNNLGSTVLTTLDFSWLEYLPHRLSVHNNPNVTLVKFKSSGSNTQRPTRRGSTFTGNNNPNVSPYDFSGFTGVNQLYTVFFIQDCNWSTAEVNKILVDIATIEASHNYGTGTINISGSNAAPDSSSGGYDGTQAVTDLVNAGYIVTTS
jgi:hypothetical protein